MNGVFKCILLITAFVLSGCAQKIVDQSPRHTFESSKQINDLASCIGDKWEKRKYGILNASLTINQRNIANGIAVTGMNDWSEFIQVRITDENGSKASVAYKAISRPIENIYLQDVTECL